MLGRGVVVLVSVLEPSLVFVVCFATGNVVAVTGVVGSLGSEWH